METDGATNVRRTLQLGEPVRYEKEYIRKDGSLVPIELLVSITLDKNGEPNITILLSPISQSVKMLKKI